ncbi:MAG TPA: hypothetical protein DCM62_07995, partial [Bacteroidales bacterium]|nr:hypothetical protein [Bacteroidales bacterium]
YDFIRIGRLFVATIKFHEATESDFVGDFHWEQFNSIPLPYWIASRIAMQEAERRAQRETQVE